MRRKIIEVAMGLFVVMIVALAGCGGGGGGAVGGGGGGNAPEITYQGKITPAVITADTAQQFFVTSLTGFDVAPSLGDPLSVSRVVKSSSRAFLAKKTITKTVASTSVAGSIPGLSGTATYLGVVETNGTGVITFTYSNYDSGDGDIYNGQLVVTVNSYDSLTDTITDSLMQFNNLSIASANEEYALQGSVHLNYETATLTETFIINIVGHYLRNDKWLKFDNYVERSVYDNLYFPTSMTQTVSGRIYFGSLGYIDLTQTTPYRYDYYNRFNIDMPNAGGPLLISGASGSKASMTPLSISQFKIEVDSNGDDIFESSNIRLWSELTDIVYSWRASLGNPNVYEVASVAVTTSGDGGTASAGFTHTQTNSLDFLLIKTDAVSGLLWSKAYGGIDDDQAFSLQETADKGFVIAGTTTVNSVPTDVQFKKGYIVKTDSNGAVIWERSLSGRADNGVNSVRQTADGGYILAGSIESFIPVTGLIGYGSEDLYLVKLDALGTVMWEKRFGASGRDVGLSVKETATGNFVVAGVSDRLDLQMNDQLYLVVTDANGNLLWEKQYGDQYNQSAHDVLVASNGDIVVLAHSTNLTSMSSELIRFSNDGTLVWEKAYGISIEAPRQNSLLATMDGGFITLCGERFNYNLCKMNSQGELVATNPILTSAYDSPNSLSQGIDGGYLVAGATNVLNANPSDSQVLLIKTDASGRVR